MTLERLTPGQFEKFRKLVYAHSGIHIEPRKVTMLSNRIRRRVKACGCDSFDSYYRLLNSPEGASELGGFLNAVTTNETFFFRTGKQFEWIKSHWITEQINRYRNGERSNHLRVLSAACSDGAEAYSIAICIAENAYRLRDWTLEIVGTDISDAALQKARAAVFESKSLEHVSERQRRRFFESIDDGQRWRVSDSIRSNVRFQNHNLMTSFARFGKFDCIFLRNVLIYFDQQARRQAVRHVIDALAPRGYVFTGPSEGVYGLLDSLEKVTPLIHRKGSRGPGQAPGEARSGGPA